MPSLTSANGKSSARYSPNGVINAKPHRLISDEMRLGPSAPVSFLPMTVYAPSQTTAANTSRLPSHWVLPAMPPDGAEADRDRARTPSPATAQAAAAHIRAPMRSRRKTQLMRAMTAGMLAITTPAETALVKLTPYNMQIENRKLPRSDSRNSSSRMRGAKGASLAGLRNQGSMATAAMPKRIQASRNTGRMATSGLDKAT